MQKQWDKFQTLAATAKLSVCIFANPQGTDWALVGLDAAGDADLLRVVMRDINARGLEFAGVTGLMADGSPRTALAMPLEDSVVDSMAALFTRYFVPRFLDAHAAAAVTATAAPDVQDDGEAFLWRLWALKDPRMDS
jgi:hypothetical protein